MVTTIYQAGPDRHGTDGPDADGSDVDGSDEANLYGLAVVQTLRFGGTVHLLGDAELPGLEVVGAILRYAPPPAATSTPSYLLVLRLARATN